MRANSPLNPTDKNRSRGGTEVDYALGRMPFLSPWRALRRALSSLALGALGLTSCADAGGRFRDYEARRAAADAGSPGNDAESSEGEPCAAPTPHSVQGPALLAIETSLLLGKPILFLGTIDTPELGDATAVEFVYRALDARDRKTRVGEELTVGPYALPRGELVAPVAESTLDGDANPVLYHVPITSKMTLVGKICGVRSFYCGTVSGETTGLVVGPFTGNFGITLLDGPDAVPERPRFGCGSADLAGPLPE